MSKLKRCDGLKVLKGGGKYIKRQIELLDNNDLSISLLKGKSFEWESFVREFDNGCINYLDCEFRIDDDKKILKNRSYRRCFIRSSVIYFAHRILEMGTQWITSIFTRDSRL